MLFIVENDIERAVIKRVRVAAPAGEGIVWRKYAADERDNRKPVTAI
jgi:hypothetical protein